VLPACGRVEIEGAHGLRAVVAEGVDDAGRNRREVSGREPRDLVAEGPACSTDLVRLICEGWLPQDPCSSTGLAS
jgi:hypothetical protein